MGPVGRVPSNFGEPGDQVYLVPFTFGGCCFMTSEVLQLFIGHPDSQSKLPDLRV